MIMLAALPSSRVSARASAPKARASPGRCHRAFAASPARPRVPTSSQRVNLSPLVPVPISNSAPSQARWPAPRAAASAVVASTSAEAPSFTVPPAVFQGLAACYAVWGASLLLDPRSIATHLAPAVPFGPVSTVAASMLGSARLVAVAALWALSQPGHLTPRAAARLRLTLLISGLGDAAATLAASAQGLLTLPVLVALGVSLPMVAVMSAAAVASRADSDLLSDARQFLADVTHVDRANLSAALCTGLALATACSGLAKIAAPAVVHAALATRASSPLLSLLYQSTGASMLVISAILVTLGHQAARGAAGGGLYRLMAASIAVHFAATFAAVQPAVALGHLHGFMGYLVCGCCVAGIVAGLMALLSRYTVMPAKRIEF